MQHFEQLGSRAENLLASIRGTTGHNLVRVTEYSVLRSSCFSSAHPGEWPKDTSITSVFPLKINHSSAIDVVARLR